MISVDALHNALALGAREPFASLTETELLLVAQHIRRRQFRPGELMLAAGTSAEWVFIVTGGSVLMDGKPAPALFDASSALFGLPVRADHVAGEAGAEALCLAKPHLFTIARECPDFVVGLATGSKRRI